MNLPVALIAARASVQHEHAIPRQRLRPNHAPDRKAQKMPFPARIGRN